MYQHEGKIKQKDRRALKKRKGEETKVKRIIKKM